MKIVLLVITLGFSASFYSQTEVGYILKNSGDKISFYDGSNSDKKKSIGGMAADLYGPIGFNERFLYYFDIDGNIKDIPNNEYSEFQIFEDEILFMSLPHSKNGSGLRVHRIIAQSDKYILGDYLGQGIRFFYIFDSEKNLVDRRTPHSQAKGVSQKAIKKVKEYFGDCPALIEEMEKNFSHPYKRGYFNVHTLLYYKDDDGNRMNELSNIKCD